MSENEKHTDAIEQDSESTAHEKEPEKTLVEESLEENTADTKTTTNDLKKEETITKEEPKDAVIPKVEHASQSNATLLNESYSLDPTGARVVPEEIKGWNWGAFAFNIFWGIGNKTYLPLLCLIPFFNIVWVFVCGAKGNEWAWENGNYSSVEEFKLVQATWKRAGVVQAIVSAIFMALSFIWVIIFIIFLISIDSYTPNTYNDLYRSDTYDKNYNNDYDDDYDYDDNSTYDAGSFDDFETWTEETYNSIELATEFIDIETDIASYKDGTSYQDLVGIVSSPDSTVRNGNTITATWWSSSYGYIDVYYDVASGLIIDKGLSL